MLVDDAGKRQLGILLGTVGLLLYTVLLEDCE